MRDGRRNASDTTINIEGPHHSVTTEHAAQTNSETQTDSVEEMDDAAALRRHIGKIILRKCWDERKSNRGCLYN